VVTETGWQEWLERERPTLSRHVSVRCAGRIYLFRQGRWAALFIVGNG
jgi:hypothetical protein